MDRIDRALRDLGDLVARDLGNEWWATRCDRVSEERRNGVVRVAVVGQFKAGKSTLVNALVGEDLLPRESVP